MAQSVEHVLGKDEVTSSSLVSSSRKTAEKSAVFFYISAAQKSTKKSLATFLGHFGYTISALSEGQIEPHFRRLSETV